MAVTQSLQLRNSGTVVKSIDNGANWTLVTSGITETLLNLSYGNGTFAASGNNGTVAFSTKWLAHVGRYKQTIRQIIYRITYGNGLFVAVNDVGTI